MNVQLLKKIWHSKILLLSLSLNLTSDYLWPWYVSYDIINMWSFTCSIYDIYGYLHFSGEVNTLALYQGWIDKETVGISSSPKCLFLSAFQFYIVQHTVMHQQDRGMMCIVNILECKVIPCLIHSARYCNLACWLMMWSIDPHEEKQ